MSERPNSGHMVRTKCSCVSSAACTTSQIREGVHGLPRLTCHIMKSLRRLTFDVRTRMSSLPPSSSIAGSGRRLNRADTVCEVSRLLNILMGLTSLRILSIQPTGHMGAYVSSICPSSDAETVFRTAVVISSREVYGEATLSTPLLVSVVYSVHSGISALGVSSCQSLDILKSLEHLFR